MNRITADRALLQCYRGVFVNLDFAGETHTPSGESSAHLSASQLKVGVFWGDFGVSFRNALQSKGSEPPREGVRLPVAFLVLAEELLGIFNKADDYHYRRSGHAHEEHDLEDVHCEDSGLKHDIHCSCDWLRIPFLA